MNIARKIHESDERGVVHTAVPVGQSRRRVEALVVWEEVAEADAVQPQDPTMADLVGLLEEGDLERPPQGTYENRDPLV
jgi:hypothetical protein